MLWFTYYHDIDYFYKIVTDGQSKILIGHWIHIHLGNKTTIPREHVLDVLNWRLSHVIQFLEINECSNLVPAFKEKGINGVYKLFMNLV